MRDSGHPQAGAYTWTSQATDADLGISGGDGVADELGLYEPLVAAVSESLTWVEYGVIEFRFSQFRPDTFGELLERYSHTNLGPKQFTTSSLLGGCLGRLATRGELVYHAGKGTGHQAYNQPSSFYIVNPGLATDQPAFRNLETYASFCLARGEDPGSVAWWLGAWPSG